MHLFVVGDSVPHGYGTDAPAWPKRLPESVDSLAPDDVTVDAATGRSLADCAARLAGRDLFAGEHGGDAEASGDGTSDGPDDHDRVVLVHAGHNDAQLSDGEPRVPEVEFVETATRLDADLAARADVDRHAFIGLLPLLRLDRPGSVPFGDEQPDRGRAYDRALAEAVATHLPVVSDEGGREGSLDDWARWTTDGVHSDDGGHAFVASVVAAWLGQG
jgi:lysophospholipase L1-like esterase